MLDIKGRTYEVVKRGLDLATAITALALLSPLIASVGAAVAVNLGTPVLFPQQRPGRDGRPFTLLKFRTMREVDEASGLVTDAQRLTPFGRALRSTSLDELPSLWNVIRGDMSIVGPRPLLVSYLSLYSPRQARRHEVRPGLTGLAQVSGRNSLTWEAKFEIDVDYVERRDLLLDLKIVLATFRAVITREGISAPDHSTMTPFGGSSD